MCTTNKCILPYRFAMLTILIASLLFVQHENTTTTSLLYTSCLISQNNFIYLGHMTTYPSTYFSPLNGRL